MDLQFNHLQFTIDGIAYSKWSMANFSIVNNMGLFAQTVLGSLEFVFDLRIAIGTEWVSHPLAQVCNLCQ
jgi:hypothetical protein